MSTLSVWIHAVANLFMFAVVTYVQRVHYPSFKYIDSKKWEDFHKLHCRRTGQIVALPMALQTVSLLLINGAPWELYFFNFLSLGTTAGFSMGLHKKLSLKFSQTHLNTLLITNWIRIVGWLGATLQALATAVP